MAGMDLEKQYVERFKDLYLQKHQKQITDAEALEYFHSLIELVRSVYQPIPSSNKQEFERLLAAQRRRENTPASDAPAS